MGWQTGTRGLLYCGRPCCVRCGAHSASTACLGVSVSKTKQKLVERKGNFRKPGHQRSPVAPGWASGSQSKRGRQARREGRRAEGERRGGTASECACLATTTASGPCPGRHLKGALRRCVTATAGNGRVLMALLSSLLMMGPRTVAGFSLPGGGHLEGTWVFSATARPGYLGLVSGYCFPFCLIGCFQEDNVIFL